MYLLVTIEPICFPNGLNELVDLALKHSNDIEEFDHIDLIVYVNCQLCQSYVNLLTKPQSQSFE